MKKIFSLVLVLAFLLSFTACAGSVPVETTAPVTVLLKETVTMPTAEPTTEPTPCPEELLYNSLPDRMKEAVDVGIVELSQLEDLDRIVTVGEASQMLQKAYAHRTGVESKTLNDLISTADYSTRNATRGWIMNIPGMVDLELTHGEEYTTYEQWIKKLNNRLTDHLWWSFADRLEMKLPIFYARDQVTGLDAESMMNDPATPVIEYAKDFDECQAHMNSDLLYGPCEKDRSFRDMAAYGFKVYDSTTGRKFIALEDDCVNPTAELTAEAAAEHALVFYHFPNPMGYPTFVAPEDVETYNAEIITADLLIKETSLPDVSNTKLPSGWHGVVMDDMELDDVAFLQSNRFHTDDRIYEYEIQTIKEAGFNYIGLNLDFNWLLEGLLYAPNKHAYVDFVREEDNGHISLERLEQLDQVLAWCMEYDIHLNIRATGIGSFSNTEMQKSSCSDTDRFLTDFTAVWQAIARRYADIPNKYLSFTPITASQFLELDSVEERLVVESVTAIQTVSPDRCIIADIFSENMNAKTFAQMGVAISFRMREPAKLLDFSSYYRYDHKTGRSTMTNLGKSVIDTFTWPYDGDMDAKKLLTMAYEDMQTFEAAAAVAKEHGVGFMLSDFGIHYQTENNGMVLPRIRYADEPYFAMISDITSTMEQLGYGWCFAHWYSPYGVAFCLPAIKTSTYEQVENYPYYIDQGMFDLFKEINGTI